jgi:hypothetical protein
VTLLAVDGVTKRFRGLVAVDAVSFDVTAGEIYLIGKRQRHGLAYNGFQRWESPLTRQFPSDAALANDLQQLSALTTRLRTYSASELPALPAIAAQAGLRLSAGVWLDHRSSNNEREIAAIIKAVPR